MTGKNDPLMVSVSNHTLRPAAQSLRAACRSRGLNDLNCLNVLNSHASAWRQRAGSDDLFEEIDDLGLARNVAHGFFVCLGR